MKSAAIVWLVVLSFAVSAENVAVFIHGPTYGSDHNQLGRVLWAQGYNTHAIVGEELDVMGQQIARLPFSKTSLSTVARVLSNTSCDDNILVSLAAEAVGIWEAEIEQWDGTLKRTTQFRGKPWSAVQQKDYSGCIVEGKVRHKSECADLARHHRDVPDGHRVVGEPILVDWCVMMGEECVPSRDIKELINTIPTCTRTLIAQSSGAEWLTDAIKDATVIASTRSQESSHPTFLRILAEQLFRTKDLPEAFAQTKAAMIAHTGTIPQLSFPSMPCTCTPPAAPPVMTAPPKPIVPPSVIQPAQRPTKILVKKQPEPAVLKSAPQSDCLAQCAKVAVPAPSRSHIFSTELIDARTPKECREKSRFATIFNREPCTNYFLAVREISRRVGKGTEFACCCRRVAKEQMRDCTPEQFKGWTREGQGITKASEEVDVKYAD
ncbi:hypothetical protein HY490_03425 [Candidatus Woesearchaeota archaeon]|nr:hypothetical protein [Candidatus Woesearchaeota archaeon]